MLLFSATVPNWVRNIANKYTDNPLTVDAVGKNVREIIILILQYYIHVMSYLDLILHYGREKLS